MTTLYEKRGRRYIPVSDWELRDGRDMMRVGTFRLTYCYTEGGRRYEYDVAPDTAGFVAAAMVARHAIEEAIVKAAMPAPSQEVPYTTREKALLDEFIRRAQNMDMLWPTWWQHAAPHQISEAAIKAAREYRP